MFLFDAFSHHTYDGGYTYTIYTYNDELYAFRFLFWFYFFRRVNIYGRPFDYHRNRKKNKYIKHPLRLYLDKTQINRFVRDSCLHSIILSQ